MSLGANIKKLRKSTGLTQEDIAKEIGVSKQTVQKYENGIITNIPSDKIEVIAKLLKTTPAKLMGWEDSESSRSFNLASPNITDRAISDEDLMFALFDGATEEEITPEMYAEVKHFAKFILERERNKNEQS